MTNVDLSNWLLADHGRIVEAISTGAAWEIWMQVEMLIILRQHNIAGAREVPFPPPYQAQHLDVSAQDAIGGRYAIELKVESATNAGAALLVSAQSDMLKIANYNAPCLVARWVVAIGYSSTARQALNGYAGVPFNNAIYNELNSIGVLLATR
jgi:hypothetical protein